MSRVERVEYIYVYVHLSIYVVCEGFYGLFFSCKPGGKSGSNNNNQMIKEFGHLIIQRSKDF